MAPDSARFRTSAYGPTSMSVDIQAIVPLEIVGSQQNSALLAAHRRWVARSR